VSAAGRAKEMHRLSGTLGEMECIAQEVIGAQFT